MICDYIVHESCSKWYTSLLSKMHYITGVLSVFCEHLSKIINISYMRVGSFTNKLILYFKNY